MQLPSVPSRRVVWEDGMHLTPQHFQAQRRYQEDQTTRTLDLLFPFAYGLSALAVDTDALQNGALALVLLRGVLPDGTVVHTPGGDVLPPPIALAPRFSPTRDSHDVHLVIPRWRSNDANVRESADADSSGSTDVSDSAKRPPTRYQAIEERVVDEATGTDPLAVRFAARNLYFLLDEELTDDVISMPFARVRRDGRGHFQLDPMFVPPSLQIGSSERLMDLLRRTVGLLEGKGSALAASLNQAPVGAVGGAAAYAGNELATHWLLHAVRSADAPLRHLLLTRSAHPEQLYLELSRLAGALSTFIIGTSPRSLPCYDHDDLTGCFDALEQRIRAHLDSVISTRAVVIPLQRTTDILHSARVNDTRCYLPGARWFLAIRADLERADLVDRVQRLTKSCASVYVLELVNRAWNGLPTEHVPIPPSGIAPKLDLTYFELTLTGGCAASLAKTQEIGVYVPQALPGAYVEVAILLPE
jgi:type VI secretion system protein ImpJ